MKPFVPHRTRVYKFGVLWFWKCQEPEYRCPYGGGYRHWGNAFNAALGHTLSHLPGRM